ncbi:TPA: YopX family protein [Streptococcus suis]
MIPRYRVAYKNKILGEVGAIDFIDETVEIPVYDSETGEYLVSYELGLNQVILMQSTGLFDKNGKEVFEGDVVTFLDDDNNPIYENAVVKFGQHTNKDTIFEREPVYIGVYVEVQKGTATFDVERMYNDYEGRFTIIGNIYENPELMEG